jgi:phage terminase large subunit GpA-like protein
MSLQTPTAEEIYSGAASAGARPDPLLTISQWADKYRTLSQRASAEPGPWRTDRTPYLREIMDCLSPSSPVERVVFMKGAQIGGTECGNNWIGYVVHQAPGPMMAVQPTVEMAKRNSKQRELSVGMRTRGAPTYFWEESPARMRRTEVRPT